jgi:hypothetical protein
LAFMLPKEILGGILAAHFGNVVCTCGMALNE